MSQDFEAPVLSILLEYPQAFDDVADRLKACHFAQDTHRLVFAELSRQIASGKGCDALTIANALDGEVSAAEVLTIAACHNHSARGLARMVDGLIERYKGRQLHALSVKLQDLAYNDAPVQERLDMAGAELARLVDDDTADEWVDAHTAAIEHLDVLEKREQGQITGWPTGLQDFDELLDGGLQPGNLVVIGARPAMGKTALAMTIGLSMASTRPVGLLSMEMPHADVRDRQAAILSRASIGQIKRPTRGLDFGRIVEGVERTKALQWYVSDKSGLNILQVRAKARQLKRKKGLDVLIVDYIGLMSGLDSKQPRAYQIEEISRGLKSLAKELGICVLCLAQVNRGATERVNQVPGLQDLRDSGAIEQDADVVGFIHRPIAANPDLGGDWAHYALLRVAKNRQGRTGDVHLFYEGEYTHFQAWSGSPPSIVARLAHRSKGMED